MNLDDFIVPSSIASPAGLTSEAPIENVQNSAHAAGISIGKKNKMSQQTGILPAASMPKNIATKSRTGEFDYVQRRVRKTSIDERSVSTPRRRALASRD